MRALSLAARGVRNLADQDLEFPPAGAAFLGPNGHGKTSLLEALSYPVLFRSFRAATDAEMCAWDAPGFRVALVAGAGRRGEFEATYVRTPQRKRILIDGSEVSRLADAVGRWIAVAFLPTDLHLVQGPAAARRQYLDRMLSLADPSYLRALMRYRRVLAQRNAALRTGRAEVAAAFDAGLAVPGARIVRARLAWVAEGEARFRAECDAMGEPEPVGLRYQGDENLADEGAWVAALRQAAPREQQRGMGLVGPQRDDLTLLLGGRSLREFGSTGQQRTAAVALRLCELTTLAGVRDSEPALLLDDVFAELDRERQGRLAARIGPAGRHQVFVTAPRRDELPDALDLAIFAIDHGAVRLRSAA